MLCFVFQTVEAALTKQLRDYHRWRFSGRPVCFLCHGRIKYYIVSMLLLQGVATYFDSAAKGKLDFVSKQFETLSCWLRDAKGPFELSRETMIALCRN